MKKLILLFIIICIHNLNAQWVRQNIPGVDFLNCISFFNNQMGVSGGWEDASPFSGRAFYTTNGGLNWIAASVPDSLRVLLSVTYFTQQNAYGVGACNLSEPFSLSNSSAKTIGLSPVIAYSGNEPIGFPSHRNFGNGPTKGYFMRTTNGGQSWLPYGTIPNSAIYLYDGYFHDVSTGFAIANTYITSTDAKTGIIKTTNGGDSWNFVSSPDSAHDLRRVKFFSPTSGVAAGFDRDFNSNFIVQGLIMKTTNGGNNWSKQKIYQVNNFNDVSLANASTGFACGVSNTDSSTGVLFAGVVYRTTNSGASWNRIFQLDTANCQGINFIQGTGTGFVFGSKLVEDPKFPGFFRQKYYFISRTTDYGQSWFTALFSDSVSFLFGSEAVDQNTWFISGADIINTTGLVLKTTNGGGPIGINPISSEVPSGFKVYQNYPNPFNPTTKIKFDLPKSGDVNFKVYDILGKVVYELNEHKQAGSYEVQFDGSNLASGVYYYSIESENYWETKKMVLIK